MKKTVLFYVHMKDPSLFFTQKFYTNTKEVIESLGFTVVVSHRISDSWRLKYDGLFVFFFKIGVVAAIISKIRGKKVFFSGGLDDLNYKTTSFIRFFMTVLVVKLCILFSDWCLVESLSDIENIKRISFNRLPRNVIYSPEAVHVRKFNCDLRQKQNTFVTVCYLTEGNLKRKGVDISLYYFKYLLKFEDYKDSVYYIIGRYSDGVQYLKQLIYTLGLDGRVILTGEVSEEEKIKLLKESKYYFQLSHYEGFGVAALEAMAAKCRVFTSGRGGLADTVQNDGIYIDIDSFDYSENTVDDSILLRMEKLTDERVEAIYKRVLETFDVEKRLSVFQQTIGESLTQT